MNIDSILRMYLTNEEYDRFMSNVRSQCEVINDFNSGARYRFRSAINSIEWARTPEGHDYWADIYERTEPLRKNQTLSDLIEQL